MLRDWLLLGQCWERRHCCRAMHPLIRRRFNRRLIPQNHKSLAQLRNQLPVQHPLRLQRQNLFQLQRQNLFQRRSALQPVWYQLRRQPAAQLLVLIQRFQNQVQLLHRHQVLSRQPARPLRPASQHPRACQMPVPACLNR